MRKNKILLIFIGIFFAARILFFFESIVPESARQLFAAQTTCNWTKTTGGGWYDSVSNWSCGVIPNGTQYDVTICNASASASTTVTATTTLTLGKLTVGQPDGESTSCNSLNHTLTLRANLTIADDDGSWAGSLFIGTRGRVDPNNQTVIVEKDFSVNGGTGSQTGSSALYFQGTGTATTSLTGTGRFITGSSNQTDNTHFDNLNLAYPGQITTIYDNSANTVRIQNGRFILNGGTVRGATATVVLVGSGGGIVTFQPKGGTFSGLESFSYRNPIVNFNVASGTYSRLNIFLSQAANGITGNLTGSTIVNDSLNLGGAPEGHNIIKTNGYNLTVAQAIDPNSLNTNENTNAYGEIRLTGTTILTATGGFGAGAKATTAPAVVVTNGNSITVGDDWNLKTQGFDHGTSTVNFSATKSTSTNIDMDRMKFYNISFTKSSSIGSDDYILKDATEVRNTMTINGASLNLSPASGSTATSTLTLFNSPFITNSGNIYANISAGVTVGGGVKLGSSTTTEGVLELGNTIVGTSTNSATLTLATIATSSSFRLGPNATFNLGDGTLILTDQSATSTPFNLAGTFIAGSGTIKYTATTTNQTVASTTYASLTIDDRNGETGGVATNTLTLDDGNLIITGNVSVRGTFSNTGGYLKENGGVIQNTSSVSFGSSSYSSGDLVSVTVTDSDENISATTTDSISVTVSLGSDSETITATETGAATGIFRGSIGLVVGNNGSSGDGSLTLTQNQGTIAVSYSDSNDAGDTSSGSTTGNAVLQGGGIPSIIGGTGGFFGTQVEQASFGVATTIPAKIKLEEKTSTTATTTIKDNNLGTSSLRQEEIKRLQEVLYELFRVLNGLLRKYFP